VCPYTANARWISVIRVEEEKRGARRSAVHLMGTRLVDTLMPCEAGLAQRDPLFSYQVSSNLASRPDLKGEGE